MLNIVLVEPEIPQNAGNIARTCAVTNSRLHLIEPMGFHLTEKNLKRAGCNYWDDVEIIRWTCLDAFLVEHEDDELHLFTGSTDKRYTDVSYSDECFLLFGRESRGLSPELIERFADSCIRIPMHPDLDSLNVSNAVAIAAYEVLRQLGFPQLT